MGNRTSSLLQKITSKDEEQESIAEQISSLGVILEFKVL
jgi:hypothetical protein